MNRANTLPPVPAGVHVIRSDELEAWVIPYGARLMQLWWLGAPEGPRPLTLGFTDPADYRQDRASIGAVCGRYANRLGDAQLARDGQVWQLDANHPLGHCIHGGRQGTGQRDWTVAQATANAVTLHLTLADGHMGFPGQFEAEVSYSLTGSTLRWQARATVDAPCPINLVQHSYWNLDGRPDLSGHRLHIPVGTRYWPTDDRELPTARTPVDGTCFDFRQGARFADADIGRLDASIELEKPTGLAHVAMLQVADLALHLQADRPNLHLYASGNLKPSAAPLGVPHGRGAAICLETEDLPNGPALRADVWYGPQRPYEHTMVFEFNNPSAPNPAG